MPVKLCPMPGCDSTGNTKTMYAFHRSVSRCPLIRVKIEGLRGILTIKQVDDILAGRRTLPNWQTPPEPTTEEGRKLLDDLRKFVAAKSKKAKRLGLQKKKDGKQTVSVTVWTGLRNNENKAVEAQGASSTTVHSGTSIGDATYNTRHCKFKLFFFCKVQSLLTLGESHLMTIHFTLLQNSIQQEGSRRNSGP